jgi:putative peptide zinc metalloprotease protein
MSTEVIDDVGRIAVSDGDSTVQLQLAEDCELLGPYESAAFDQPQYLLRRGDGQLIQVSRLLYLLVTYMDGTRDAAEIAERVSADLGRTVSAENVGYLVRNRLRPSGLVKIAGTLSSPLPRARPLLALRFRAKLLPERIHRSATLALQVLFWPPWVVTVVAGLIALDAWVFATRGLGVFGLTRHVMVHPMQFLLLTALVMAACVFHEFGHAAAARYGGAKPGAIGIGVYLGFPVFYTDVSDSYRLNRRGRLRTDLGGVYFNAVAIVAAGVTYAATGFEPLLVFAMVSQLQVLYQFLPTVRMDGYYVVSDLIGVPNLFAFVRPVATRLLRRSNQAHAKLGQLRPGARRAITAWVCLTVPILLINVGFFAAVAPQVLPALWLAARRQEQLISTAIEHGAVIQAMNQSIGLLILAATGAGLLLTGALIVVRLSRLATRLAARRFAVATHRSVPALFAMTVALLWAAVATVILGVVQHAAAPVHASVACSFLAALTLASSALVGRKADLTLAGASVARLRGFAAALRFSRLLGALLRTGGPSRNQPRAPIDQYDDLRVVEILPLLKGLGPKELQQLRLYEAQRRSRRTVLARIDTILEKSIAQTSPVRHARS